MAQHGGCRSGAGRPLGAANKATTESKARLSDIAKNLSEEALEVLAEVMRNGQTDSAKIAAATAILDRGYGKPTKEVVASIPNIQMPTKIQLVPFED